MTTVDTPLLSRLERRGFEIQFASHARAILSVDFPSVLVELSTILAEMAMPIDEIIASGGGETKGTQRLRKSLVAAGWGKTTFEIKKTINGRQRESISHEVDHVREFHGSGTVALEIEWNNKDPFFDRDLNNFRLLFELHVIDVGIIVTRATELQSIFNLLGKGSSYGNSTTHISKLLPRIEGGGGGGCPIVAFAIKKECYVDDCR